MPTLTRNNFTFDARPDRIDLRDRVYQPRLVSLPGQWPGEDAIRKYLPNYARTLVLNQESEGACTGFGLAAVINYLRWKENGYDVTGLTTVSPTMLYHMARIYDEWPGEDYQGSSCRGAMKGWHRHGVCASASWPHRDLEGRFLKFAPRKDWQSNAAQCPLGAYYRIDKDSISDLQSAIYEVGAIYVSASVHEGWFLPSRKSLVVIPYSRKSVGGHAFALVGYNDTGFIVQNSWGQNWGYHGFAILAYQDWVENVTDAWVAVMGAPMQVDPKRAAVTFTTTPLQQTTAAAARGPGSSEGFRYRNRQAAPLTESKAYLHSLVLGNNGVPINRLLDAENVAAAVERVTVQEPQDWLGSEAAGPQPRLALYVHGGLNSEADSIKRIRMMAPYFLGNGVYPLFLTWKTGALESIGGILRDSLRNIFRGMPEMRDEGILDRVREGLADARDRSIEVACEHLLVKSLWSEMKQNAAAATDPSGGLGLLAAALARLKKGIPDLELHLVGHSAGSIVLGHLLSQLDQQLAPATLTLFAPACTLKFANEHFGRAFDSKVDRKCVHVDILDDEREKADSVGPYGKSLLYLVSRALETRHKMPLLGMQWAWRQPAPEDLWADDAASRADLETWQALADGISLRLHDKKRRDVATGAGTVKLAHGSFDNDIEVVSRMLERMRGGPLKMKVENLAY